jgi:hypothetical protein
MIAALYVETNGTYFDLDGVDPWDEARDARRYAGPHPVVAHPPCNRWAYTLAPLNERRYGLKVGEDGGCFDAALLAVRRCGGVLEHPAYSLAWARFGLPRPVNKQQWTEPDAYGGRSIFVEQGHYGHKARKGTYLYAVGTEYPDLIRGKARAVGMVSNTNPVRGLPRLSSKEAKATPPAFRALLLRLARSVLP